MLNGSPRVRVRRRVDGDRLRALRRALALACACAACATLASACSLFLDFDITGGTDERAPSDGGVDRIVVDPVVQQPDADVQQEQPFDDALPPAVPAGDTVKCSADFELCDTFEDEDALAADLGRWTANAPTGTAAFAMNAGKGARSLSFITTTSGTLQAVPLYTHPPGQAQRVEVSLDLRVAHDDDAVAEGDVVTLLSLQPFGELRFDEPDRPRTDVLVTSGGVVVRSRSFSGNDRDKQVTIKELDQGQWVRLRIVSTFKRNPAGTALHVFVDDMARGTRDFASLPAPSSGAVSLAIGALPTSGAPGAVLAWFDNVVIRAL